jgi:hypothetical protein
MSLTYDICPKGDRKFAEALLDDQRPSYRNTEVTLEQLEGANGSSKTKYFDRPTESGINGQNYTISNAPLLRSELPVMCTSTAGSSEVSLNLLEMFPRPPCSTSDPNAFEMKEISTATTVSNKSKTSTSQHQEPRYPPTPPRDSIYRENELDNSLLKRKVGQVSLRCSYIAQESRSEGVSSKTTESLAIDMNYHACNSSASDTADHSTPGPIWNR